MTEEKDYRIDVKYSDNPELQQIISNFIRSATFCQMSDGHVHRSKFYQSAKVDIQKLEKMVKA